MLRHEITLAVATLILQALSQFAFINLYQLPSISESIKVVFLIQSIPAYFLPLVFLSAIFDWLKPKYSEKKLFKIE